jgi:hypothetical protein
VVEIGRDVYAFEVKLGVRPTASDARHLEWLRDGLGERFVAAFVAHSGADSSELTDRIWAVPITDL